MATKGSSTTKKASKKKGAGKSVPRTPHYDVFKFAQCGADQPALVIFHASVKDILSWSKVGVLSATAAGHQREPMNAKINGICNFLAADKRNAIPTAVIVAFTKGAATFEPSKEHPASGFGQLSIIGGKDSANIVDGQHRLYGIKQYKGSAEVAVVGLLEVDNVEKAFQFLIINNKSTKVPARHAKAVLASMKSTALSERLLGARLAFDVAGIRDVDLLNSDPESPFYQSVDWSTTEEDTRMVQATALEASLSYLGNLSVAEFDDRDVRRSVFLAMWKAIKAIWTDLWVAGSRLMSKVGIVCLTRFVIDTITKWADSDELDIDILDLDKIKSLTKSIIKYMDRSFWTQPWASGASGGFDTNQGRERIMKALTQLYRNGKRDDPWYTDIEIIEPIKT